MSSTGKKKNPVSFGRIVEIVGLIGIVVSLVFLGYELKRSNDIAEAQAVSEIYNMTNEMGLLMAEIPELAEVFRTAQYDFGSLQDDDRFMFYVIVEYVINTNEAAWKYYDKGIINASEADTYTQTLCRLIRTDVSLVGAWKASELDRLPGFFEYVSGVCNI